MTLSELRSALPHLHPLTETNVRAVATSHGRVEIAVRPWGVADPEASLRREVTALRAALRDEQGAHSRTARKLEELQDKLP